MGEDAIETLYYVRSDSLGVDPEIGTRLAQAFWNSFHERLEGTATFAFANRGIFLALDDSPVLEGLKRLAEKGCPIYVCGTCMDFYGVRERLAVGEPGSIPVLQGLMCDATKVVTF
jgi:DsrE/DsrF-like family